MQSTLVPDRSAGRFLQSSLAEAGSALDGNHQEIQTESGKRRPIRTVESHAAAGRDFCGSGRRKPGPESQKTMTAESNRST